MSKIINQDNDCGEWDGLRNKRGGNGDAIIISNNDEPGQNIEINNENFHTGNHTWSGHFGEIEKVFIQDKDDIIFMASLSNDNIQMAQQPQTTIAYNDNYSMVPNEDSDSIPSAHSSVYNSVWKVMFTSSSERPSSINWRSIPVKRRHQIPEPIPRHLHLHPKMMTWKWSWNQIPQIISITTATRMDPFMCIPFTWGIWRRIPTPLLRHSAGLRTHRLRNGRWIGHYRRRYIPENLISSVISSTLTEVPSLGVLSRA